MVAPEMRKKSWRRLTEAVYVLIVLSAVALVALVAIYLRYSMDTLSLMPTFPAPEPPQRLLRIDHEADNLYINRACVLHRSDLEYVLERMDAEPRN